MAYSRLRRLQPASIYLACGAALYFITMRVNWLATDLSHGFGHSNAGDFGIRATNNGVQTSSEIRMTKFLTHAPGFSVIENLYWQNNTWIVITDSPWAVPAELVTVRYSVNTKLKPPKGQDVLRVYGIRNPALSREAREELMVGRSITWQDASEMTLHAVDLSSPMLLNTGDNFVSHYYHWIGEIFLGQWRIWSHFAWRTGATLPQFETIAFPQQWSVDEAPDGSKGGDSWQDRAGANVWFTKKFFPRAHIETRSTWKARAETNQLYRMPLVVLGDRAAGHAGPSSAYKPFGDVLRLPVSADYLVTLRDRLLAGYSHSHLRANKGRPVLLYLERQDSGRRLNQEDHDRLVEAFQKLDDDGVVEFKLRRFTKEIPFEEQVATVANADIFVAVHGNGLTHVLWMDPGSRKAVFEMQPASCSITDYSPLAHAAGVQHYMVRETSFCKPEECPKRGCEVAGGINTPDIRVDPRVITDEIKKIVSG